MCIRKFLQMTAILFLLTCSNIKAEEVYLLTLEVYESTFTLNPFTHIKNSMNTATFTIPTTKKFFDSVKEGEKLLDNFKYGSLLIKGSFSDHIVKVVKKEVAND